MSIPLAAIADEPDGDGTSELDKLVAEAVGVEVIRQDNETLLDEPAPEFAMTPSSSVQVTAPA